MSRMFGERWSSHASATCMGVALRDAATSFERRGLQRSEAAEREERDVGDALRGEVVDEGVVRAMGDVVEVLDADDFGDGLRLGQLRGLTLLRPRWRMRPCCLSSARTVSGCFDRGIGRGHARRRREG